MDRLTAVALIVLGLTIPACAQRGASRGAFSGHAVQASRGGFSVSASNRSISSPRYTGSRSPMMVRSLQSGGAGNSRARQPYTGDTRHRRPYVSPYGARFPYGLPVIGAYYMGYPNDIGYDDAPDSTASAPEGYDAPPPNEGQAEPPMPYQPTSDLPHQSPALGNEEAVTLIYKDGRLPEQIYNYVLTRTTLYVGGPRHREISIDQLDLAATAKVNRDVGVDFHLPDAAR
jgi:hypothetical protein